MTETDQPRPRSLLPDLAAYLETHGRQARDAEQQYAILAAEQRGRLQALEAFTAYLNSLLAQAAPAQEDV